MNLFGQLMMYVLVAETKSFSAAADKLSISPNAVNKQVTQLEQELNLTLLMRSTRKLTLTEVGKEIYQQGKTIQQQMDDVHKYAQSLQQEPHGKLSVVSTVGLGQELLTPRLADFLGKHPNLELNLQFSDQFPNLTLSTHSIDIAFGFSASMLPNKDELLNLIQRPLRSVERIVCASPAYLAKYGEPKSYEDLKHHCYIMHSQNSKNPLLQACEKRSIQFKSVVTVNNTDSIIKMLVNGAGIASTPDFVAQAKLASGELKRIFSFHQEPKINTYLYYQQSRYVPTKIKCFVDFFKN